MTAAAGVQSGDVQVMFNPQGAGPVPFSNDISFNLKSPGLSDKRVRQAFIYALDRPSLLSAFFPDRARLANAAMKQDAWRNTALDNLYPFDAAKAKNCPRTPIGIPGNS